jgi:hypothetical protein
MKYAFVIALLFTACSVRHESEQYACTDSLQCDPSRFCDNGYCVLKGSIDAPTIPRDAPKNIDAPNNPNCPPGCTSCSTSAHTCTIDCAEGANCANTVTCPQGYACTILCDTDNSCRNGVNCQLGTACEISCSGKSSCQGVACGTGPCGVKCTGTQSCKGVSCNNSCACDVSCGGLQSCDNITCTSVACTFLDKLGCTSQSEVCHSCQ